MPRYPRFDFPGVPQHVIQRGNNRQPCFLRDQDYSCYLQLLYEACPKHGCLLHAYVLMTNHVHLLVTPTAPGAISSAMQTLGQRYVAHVNATYRRTGTLWEGRYKSCLVDSESYVLTCYRYIELNPVRAAIVETPEAYRWSTYHMNGLGRRSCLVTPHREYVSLGRANDERTAAYRDMFRDAISDDRLQKIRTYAQQQRVLGSGRFRESIETELRQVTIARPRGRPEKPKTEPNQ
jgi:putative transposase